MDFTNNKVYLITGVAGFIGSFLVKKLLVNEHNLIIGVDNLNGSYDVNLKKFRLQSILKNKNFYFYQINILNFNDMEYLFKKYPISLVIHLAARAGVRSSLEIPELYYRENVIGTLNILKLMTKYNINNIIAASTSSVYNSNSSEIFKESAKISEPSSPYAASKIAMENLLYVWSYLYNINVKVIRYFTVYGPLSRPDMAILKFLIQVNLNKHITVFGDGNQLRDFTYIDDAVNATILISSIANNKDRFSIFNVGSENPVSLNTIIRLLEKYSNRKIKINYTPRILADSIKTHSCSDKIKKACNWTPKFDVNDGVKKVVDDFFKNINLFHNLII